MAGSRMGGAVRRIHHLFAEGTVAGLPDGQLLERFLARGDEAAFAALVERHGPMVLGICRSVLRHPEDAEDAFQATFLVLVCKGRSIRGGETVGGWLRRVAHRIAVRAGADADRRRARERRAAIGHAAALHRDEPEDDWRRILHEELARLSDKYRLPLLLCDLEGKTHAQAAAELGCGPATVQRRLNASRALLRSRLTRRGVALTAGSLAVALGRPAVASVPPAWVEAAVAAARSFASRPARLAIGQVIATAAEGLAHRCLRSMALGRLSAVAALSVALVALGGIAWGVAAAGPDEPVPSGRARLRLAPGRRSRAEHRRRPSPGSRPSGGPPTPETSRSAVGSSIRRGVPSPGPRSTSPARGSLLGVPDSPRHQRAGRPVPVRGLRERVHLLERRLRGDGVSIVARAAGYACGLDDGGDASGESTVTMARDDAIIAGRVVDLEGRPVARASVKVMEVRLSDAGNFGDEISVRAIKVLNAVRPVSGPYARSVQAAVAEQLDAGLKNLEDRKEWATVEFPFLLNRVDVRDRARIPARCDDRPRRPVPDHGDRPRADRHAATRRADDRDHGFRRPDLAGRHDPPPGPKESPFLRPLDGLRRDVRARRRTDPADRGCRPRPRDRTPSGRHPGLWQTQLRATGLDHPDDHRRPRPIPARRAAAGA